MTTQTKHTARIVDQFTRWAKPFADNAVHSDADGMARSLAAAAITAESRVLDVACGPGIVACAAAARAAHVTGIDLTPAMIAQARERQAGLGLTNMEWRVGDASALPFDDNAFDIVVTRYSFHHILQPSETLAEMKRVCRVGGRIVVIDATPTPETQAAYDRMETLRDPSHASALTIDQMRALGHAAGLGEAKFDGYRLDARIDTLADQADMAALAAMLDEDIASGKDRIGVVARRDGGALFITFPISIFAWTKA
jgi:ubiquinone/menaquinone biosynthesis C-methylase UbiE